MAAWLGLTPRQMTTGGKPRLLGISKRGNRYLRKNLIHGGEPCCLTWSSASATWALGARIAGGDAQAQAGEAALSAFEQSFWGQKYPSELAARLG